MSSVFVSGANGYVAQHLVVQLISKGYNVIGSVRTQEKGEILANNLKTKNFQYVVIEDITKETAFDKVLKDHPEFVGFFHAASPVYFNVEDVERDIIVPAIKGTETALNAVKKYGHGIERFVYTSSFAAMVSKEHTKDTVITEDTWNQLPRDGAIDSSSAYQISKKFAEKAVWNFAENETKFSVNVISPNMVFGPQAFDSDVRETLNFSAEIVNSLLKLNTNDPIPPMATGFIDVRDIARAHIFALESEVTKFRFLCSEERYTTQLIMDVIHKNFPQLSNLPMGEPGTGSDFSQNAKIDNSKTKKLIGPFMDLETSIVDTVKQILNNQ